MRDSMLAPLIYDHDEPLEEQHGGVRAGQRRRQVVLVGRLEERCCHLRIVGKGDYQDINLAVVLGHGRRHL